MKKFILLYGTLISILFVWPLTDAHGALARAEEAFRQADIINDGRIDAGEFDMYHQRVFRMLDKDDDGILTLNECAGSCFTPDPGEKTATTSGTLHYKFETIDADGSGQIAEYEYILYARERFENFDANNDYLIDEKEFCVFYRESMPCTFTAAKEKTGEYP